MRKNVARDARGGESEELRRERQEKVEKINTKSGDLLAVEHWSRMLT